MKEFEEHLINLEKKANQKFMQEFGVELSFSPGSRNVEIARLIYEMLKFELEEEIKEPMMKIEENLKPKREENE